LRTEHYRRSGGQPSRSRTGHPRAAPTHSALAVKYRAAASRTPRLSAKIRRSGIKELPKMDEGHYAGTIAAMRHRHLRWTEVAVVFPLAAASVMAQLTAPEPSPSPRNGKPSRFVVQASPEALWPADGRYVEITVKVIVTDGYDPLPRLRLAAITCNQKWDPGVDVREASFGTDDRVFLLKAMSSLSTRDRTYRITYQVIDSAGNSSSATAGVVVSRRAPATPASRQ
jgi:hypothetical protein